MGCSPWGREELGTTERLPFLSLCHIWLIRRGSLKRRGLHKSEETMGWKSCRLSENSVYHSVITISHYVSVP